MLIQVSLGFGVAAGSEIIVRNCIVMPHKELSGDFIDEILL